MALAARNARVTPDQEGDRGGLGVTTRDGEKGEGQQCTCACVCVCVCLCLWSGWGRRGGLLAQTLRGENAKSREEGVKGCGAYRDGPCRVLGDQSLPPRGVLQALRSYVSPSRAGWPSLWPGGTVSAISHSSLAPTGTPSRRPRQGNARGVGRGWVPPDLALLVSWEARCWELTSIPVPARLHTGRP